MLRVSPGTSNCAGRRVRQTTDRILAYQQPSHATVLSPHSPSAPPLASVACWNTPILFLFPDFVMLVPHFPELEFMLVFL